MWREGLATSLVALALTVAPGCRPSDTTTAGATPAVSESAAATAPTVDPAVLFASSASHDFVAPEAPHPGRALECGNPCLLVVGVDVNSNATVAIDLGLSAFGGHSRWCARSVDVDPSNHHLHGAG